MEIDPKAEAAAREICQRWNTLIVDSGEEICELIAARETAVAEIIQKHYGN